MPAIVTEPTESRLNSFEYLYVAVKNWLNCKIVKGTKCLAQVRHESCMIFTAYTEAGPASNGTRRDNVIN